MKQFKKSVSLLIVLAIAGVMSAQKYGLEAAYVSSVSNDDDAVAGIQIGPVGEVQIAGPLAFQYGIKYQLLLNSEEHILGVTDYSGHFVQVPLRLKANFPLSSDLSVFAFGGPNIDFGLDERYKTTTPFGGAEVITNVYPYKIDSNDDGTYDYSRFNLQLGLGAGVQYHNLTLKVGYDWGMNDLNLLDDTEIHRNQLTLSVGYLL